MRPDRVQAETLLALAPFGERERREMMEARAPVMFHAPSVLRFGYCTDASNHRFARHLLASRGQPDLGTIAQRDLVPTLLAMLGLPLAEDMPGRVAEAALPAGVRPLPERRASYGRGAAGTFATDSPGAEDYEARLRSLGYIR